MSFDIILKDLVGTVGALGAIMLDYDAEMVASFSESAASDIDLVGAHHAVVFNIIKRIAAEGKAGPEIRSVIIMTENMKVIISAIKEGYCLIIALDKSKSTGLALIEAEKSIKRLEAEMG